MVVRTELDHPQFNPDFRSYMTPVRAQKMLIDWNHAREYNDNPPYHVLFALSQPNEHSDYPGLQRAAQSAFSGNDSEAVTAQAYLTTYGLRSITQGMNFVLNYWNPLSLDDLSEIANNLRGTYLDTFKKTIQTSQDQDWRHLMMSIYTHYHRGGAAAVMTRALSNLGYPPRRLSFYRAMELIKHEQETADHVSSNDEIAAMLKAHVPPVIPRFIPAHSPGLLKGINEAGPDLVSELFSLIGSRVANTNYAWEYFVQGKVMPKIAGENGHHQNVSQGLKTFRKQLGKIVDTLPEHLKPIARLMLIRKGTPINRDEFIAMHVITAHHDEVLPKPPPEPLLKESISRIRSELVAEASRNDPIFARRSIAFLQVVNNRVPLQDLSQNTGVSLKRIQDNVRHAQEKLIEYILLNYPDFHRAIDLIVGNFPPFLEDQLTIP